LLATLEPNYDQTHVASSKSSHLFQESLHGYYEIAFSTPPLVDNCSLLYHEATTTFKLITWWIFSLMNLHHLPPILQAFPYVSQLSLWVKFTLQKVLFLYQFCVVF